MAKKSASNRDTAFYVKWMWICFIGGLLVSIGLFLLVSFTKMPSRDSLENPKYKLASVIYTDDNKELGRYYTENRAWVPYSDLNRYVVDALVATEDERYYQHTGIDLKGTARAFVFFGKRGGASTITQQLAKQFYTPKPGNYLKRVWQKMKEWVIATEFEKRYTKGEIIAMLLNKYEFIYGANGIGAAAKTYFGKDQRDLDVFESAVLVGMFKNPSYYNPYRNPENALRRTQTVLKQMVKNDYLSQAEYDVLKEREIDMGAFNRPMHYDGEAPYFRAELKKYLSTILDKPGCRKPDGTKYNIYKDGLRIYTTINLTMQRYAEQAAAEHMKNLQETYWKRWNDKDPWSYRLEGDARDEAKQHLRSLIRNTDRYRTMRTKYLASAIKSIADKEPSARLRDIDISRMVSEGKQKGYLQKLKRRKVITGEQVSTYDQIMDMPEWADLVQAYATLQRAIRKDFNKPRKMTVFAYNAKGEKTVTMSPLDSIKYHHQHMQIGSISIEPQTGYVRTWVGGVNYKYFQYDHVQSHRQVGSTFKPFIYATAVSNGISPCYKIKDQQYVIAPGSSGFNVDKTWAPGNASGFSGQWMTLKDGLKTSTNAISVALLKEIGSVEPVRDLAANFGIDKESIPPYPSIALGVPELKVLDMAAAYTTFANDGVYTKPLIIQRIEDKDGKIIYSGVPEQKRAINPKHNFAMVNMLQYAAKILTEYKGIKSQVGGKTGTTNDHIDGWFMGITPNLVVGTWVGGESKYVRFYNLSDGQGSKMARPMFTNFIKKLEAHGDPSLYDVGATFKASESDGIVVDCGQYAELVPQDTTEQQIIQDDEFDVEF